jgi:spermidine/putrescine transport system permease protein
MNERLLLVAGSRAGAGGGTTPGYATRLGAVVNSRLYRSTAGALVATRGRRMALLATVPLLWMIALNVGPVFQLVRISFLQSYPIAHSEDAALTLANYAQFFSEPLYFVPFWRSLIFATAVTAITLLVVYPVAYYVAKVVRPEGRNKALLLLLLPFWAGEVIRTFSVIMLLANRGAVNMVLRDIGLIERPIPMLYSYFSLSFGIIYLVCLYMLLPLYAALEKIPNHLLEAAADLGAGPFTRFRRIILPLSRDGIVSGCCLVFLTNIGVFATPVLLGGPNTVLFTETISTFFHGATDKWPTGAAFATIMLVVSLSIAGLFMKVVGGRATRLM